jgi:hypothetical protein
MSHFKRAVYTIDQGYSEEKSEALLREDIKVAKTARTIMLDRISEWAGAYDKEAFEESVLPKVWGTYIKIVQDDGKPAPVEEAEETDAVEVTVEEDALAPEEMEPVVVVPVLPSARHDDLAEKPQSEVVAPDEISLGEILGKIDKDNSED